MKTMPNWSLGYYNEKENFYVRAQTLDSGPKEQLVQLLSHGPKI